MIKQRTLLITAVLFLAVLSVGLVFVNNMAEREISDHKRLATGIALSQSFTIQRQLDRSLSSTFALASILRQEDNREIHDFDAFAADMIKSYGGISSLQLAPNGVILQTYPVEGTEDTIGYDILEDHGIAIESLKSEQLMLAGPFDLQGGRTLVGRLPVFISDEKTGEEEFWGFTLVFIRLDDFLSTLNLETLTDRDHDYELYQINPETGEKEVFDRSSKTELEDPVSFDFVVPNGKWTLAIMHREGWYSKPALLFFILLAVLVSILVSGLTYTVLNQTDDLRREVKQRTEEIERRKKTEEALQESEDHHRTLIESSTDAIISIDESMTITLWNQAAEKILGYSNDEVIGKSLDIIIPEKYQESHKKGIKRFLKTRVPKVIGKSVELEAKRRDGKIIPIELSLSAVKLEKGYTFTGIIRDITERKHAEEELKRYSNELEQSNKLKDLFIDIMRHDLLNPAVAARSMADLILKKEEDPKKKEILEIIYETNKRIIDMIENASVLATLESRRKLEVEEMDLGVILKSAAKEMTPLADEKKVKIKISINGEEFKASVNPLIHDVFSNLISNAIKYGPEDSEVVVGIKGNSSKWNVSVTDNGPGIPDEYKETIFTRFKRIKKEGVKGTGLGLTIVKKVVEAHEGRVWVENNPGGGSIFYVALPKPGHSLEGKNVEE